MTVGSPPQVRGKAEYAALSDAKEGITPAGAGKRKKALKPRWNRGDHPRGCGEKSIYGGAHHISIGSPPQVRGKAHACPCRFAISGITPAGAGKSRVDILISHQSQDHPRRCGEKGLRVNWVTPGLGSPPQVRGKDRGKMSDVVFVRITPAGAGKSRPAGKLWE